MIKLVVGLGNPGRQYEKTRHNAGFLFLDKLIAGYGGQWQYRSEFEGYVAEICVSANKLILLKPDTFMNKSGCAVGKLVRYYKLHAEEVLVVHDEMDFDVGVLKLKAGGGHAGHNGLRDIIAHLGAASFLRLRLGVGRPVAGRSVADYVLSVPSAVDFGLLLMSFDKVMVVFSELVSGKIDVVMSKINADKK
ncbi:aminoacyl-tRNA hydrolase [Methylosoma difficile]